MRAAGENQFNIIINRGGNIQTLTGGFEPLQQYQINLKFNGDALKAQQSKSDPFWEQKGALQTWLRSASLNK